MPEVSGVDFYREVEARWPSLRDRLVVLTGGAFAPDIVQFLDNCELPVLEKPFSVQALREIVASSSKHDAPS